MGIIDGWLGATHSARMPPAPPNIDPGGEATLVADLSNVVACVLTNQPHTPPNPRARIIHQRVNRWAVLARAARDLMGHGSGIELDE